MNTHTTSPKTVSAYFAFGLSLIMILAMLFLPILGLYVGSLLYYGEVIDALFDPDVPDGVLLALSVYFNAFVISVLGLLLLYAKIRHKQQLKQFLGIKPFGIKPLLFYLGVLLMYLLFSEVLLQYLDSSPMDFMDGMITPTSFMPVMVAVVIVAPLYEELIFRGVILGAWLSTNPHHQNQTILGLTPPQLRAGLISSALFTLVHLQYDVVGLMLIFGLSLLFCHARIRHGLGLAIILHFINNAIAMMLYLYQTPVAV